MASPADSSASNKRALDDAAPETPDIQRIKQSEEDQMVQLEEIMNGNPAPEPNSEEDAPAEDVPNDDDEVQVAHAAADITKPVSGAGKINSSNATPSPATAARCRRKKNSEDGNNETRPYNVGIGSAVPSNTKLPPTVIGAMELLTYFPHHIRWPELIFRLHRSKWNVKNMAKAQLHARGQLTSVELDRRDAALRHAISTAGKDKFGDDWNGAHKGKYRDHLDLKPVKVTDFPESEYPNGMLEYYDVSDAEPLSKDNSMNSKATTLAQLYDGVVNHPQGSHRGILTQAILWAARQTPPFKKNDDTDYTISDIVDIGKAQGFQLPPSAHTAQWDWEAFAETKLRVAEPSD